MNLSNDLKIALGVTANRSMYNIVCPSDQVIGIELLYPSETPWPSLTSLMLTGYVVLQL